MRDLIIYIILAIIGYFAGCRLREHNRLRQFAGKVQIAAIVVLLVFMGMRMGANEEVTENLRSIGLISVCLTLLVMLFSGIAAGAARYVLGMDRRARIRQGKQDGYPLLQAGSSSGGESETGGSQKLMAVLILISVTAGMLMGYFLVPDIFAGKMDLFDSCAGLAVNSGLYILLLLIGYNMGLDGTVIENFKKVGARIILFPFIVMAGAFLAACFCTFFMNISVKEALAVTAGFGWYSLAPGIILEAGLARCAAISFMHCIMREYFSLLLVPVVAKKVGYMEAVGICGATAMGVCLPIVERSTRSDVVIYSFISGIIHTVSVPILIPLLVG